MFNACLVCYPAAVYLVPSGPDHTYSMANWFMVSAGLGWALQMMAKMVVQWSGVHWVVGQSRKNRWALGCSLCVSSPTQLGIGDS